MPSVLEVLDNESDRILERALEELVRSNEVHYADLGPELARQRLADLLALVNSSIAQRDLVPMIEYSTTVADERFDAGFDIREVQRAFHVLEEAIWERVVDTVEPATSRKRSGWWARCSAPAAMHSPASTCRAHVEAARHLARSRCVVPRRALTAPTRLSPRVTRRQLDADRARGELHQQLLRFGGVEWRREQEALRQVAALRCAADRAVR